MLPVGSLRTWDIKDVLITVGATPLTGGFAPDSKCSVSSDNDRYSHTADVDGYDVVRSRNHDNVATVTIKVLQGSGTDDILKSYSMTDHLLNGGIFPLSISKVGETSTILVSPFAYIIKDPDESLDKEVGTREWAIRAVLPSRGAGLPLKVPGS
jgi:hypothetical protein